MGKRPTRARLRVAWDVRSLPRSERPPAQTSLVGWDDCDIGAPHAGSPTAAAPSSPVDAAAPAGNSRSPAGSSRVKAATATSNPAS